MRPGSRSMSLSTCWRSATASKGPSRAIWAACCSTTRPSPPNHDYNPDESHNALRIHLLHGRSPGPPNFGGAARLAGRLLVRYANFLRELVTTGSLGTSLVSGRPVAALLAERLPYTILLALAATALAAGAGLAVGILAGTRPGTWADTALMALVNLGLALPTFWVALLLILFFSLRLRWLPVVGAGTPLHLVLPAVTLALPTAAVVARLMRSSLVDVIGADFVRTAAGKGLPK
ncbi:MAG: hypothetical protein DCC57_17310, partial [Chloroflexi bacterium]